MPSDAAQYWTEQLRTALSRCDAEFVRQIAGNLLRLRQKQTTAELLDKLTAWPGNPVSVDRRLRELPSASRTLLALLSLSRQPAWRLHHLLELLSCLDVPDGLEMVRELISTGFLCPLPFEEKLKLKDFEDWLGKGAASGHWLFAHPQVSARAVHVGWELAAPPSAVSDVHDIREADGLECFLRLGVLWQQVKAGSLRLTQQGDLFKRDHERLSGDGLLSSPMAAGETLIPQFGHFLLMLAAGLHVLRREEGQVVGGELPAAWYEGLGAALGDIWAALMGCDGWNADNGWSGLASPPSPYTSAGLLALGLLATKTDSWLHLDEIGQWIARRHCFWKGQPPRVLDGWAERFLLGVAFQLRLVEIGKDRKDRTVVRLSATGRAVLGLAAAPPATVFPKTLLVQPNLEMIAYRQGLSTGLIASLSRFANWTALGAACTLQLQPESVYRGLESGCTVESIRQTLQQHSVKELPDAVMQSLRTWANKHERLTVFSQATLLEFGSLEELETALSRGLPGERIGERLLLVANDGDIDYRHLRLVGTRDYGLPPGQCVDVADDGVTLSVDLTRADLLLETEIIRFAAPATDVSVNGRRVYRLTPESLSQARHAGLGVRALEEWFPQRTGQPLSPAARLLLAGPELQAVRVDRRVVLEVADASIADGLLQWPETRGLIETRLGPRALAVAEENVQALRGRLEALGIPLASSEVKTTT
jgi:hypothetical protein